MSAPLPLPALDGMGDEQLSDFISRHLAPAEPAGMWEFLTSAEVVARTRSALTVLLNDVNLQISAESARMDSLPRMSAAEYQEERREYNARRARALRFKAMVERRLRQAKDAEQRARMERHVSHQAAHDQPNREAARALAVAIAAHRDAVLASGVTPEKGDVELWAVLSEVRLPYCDRMATAAEILADGAWTEAPRRRRREPPVGES